MKHKLGLLAYGSLIAEPGPDIEAVTTAVIRNVTTPFNVEFARRSSSRDMAPTLVPVTEAGAQVPAVIYIVSGTQADAEQLIYARETRSKRPYKRPAKPTLEQVWVDVFEDFSDVETVLYTRIGDNIAAEDRNAAYLAKAAIESAEKRKDGKDGISYLREKLAQGMITPLSGPYEAEILRRLEVKTLDEALKKINGLPSKDA